MKQTFAFGAGSVVGKRFRVTEPIARGGMAEVWAASDAETGAVVVVKTPRESALQRPDLIARFEREAALLARVVSPHVAQFYGYFEEGARPFIVCERLIGETLASRLKQTRVLTLADLAPIIEHVLLALRDAHAANVLHRDLSPNNVFLCGEPECAKLIDFGIGKPLEDPEPMTPDDATLGSFAYMAPEQWLDPSKVDPRADLYALGTIVFRALAGSLPFPEKNAMRLLALKRDFDAPTLAEITNAPYPPAAYAFVARALARNRDDRFASAMVMLDAWKQIFSSAPAQSPWPSPAITHEAGDTTATMTHSRPKR